MSAVFEDPFVGMDFRHAIRDAAKGLLLKPVLTNYLFDAKFPAFDVHFPAEEMERRPDGWFHPSTHPMWSERQLFAYLAFPDLMQVERKQYMGTLSVTIGKAMHSFIAMCLKDAGVRPDRLNVCRVCPPDANCDEPGVVDAEAGERGHMDGILDLSGFSLPNPDLAEPVFEFKCLAPETPVSMADGTLLPAEKVSVGDWVLGWDEQGGALAPRQVRDVWDNGVVPVWTVVTREGRRIGVTDEHPFLTGRGWVMARDLVAGDKVRLAFGSDWAEGQGDVEEAYTLGVLTGDGGLTGQSVTVHNVDPGVLNRVGAFVVSRDCRMVQVNDVTWRIRGVQSGRGRNAVREILRREQMQGTDSRTKRVPHSVWTGGPQAWAAFLSGYFDADGTVVLRGSYPHLHWSSVNHDLLVECQTLLAYLGVRSSIMRVSGRYRDAEHISWRLLVRDSRAVRRATEVLDLASVKGDRLAEIDLPERSDGRWVRHRQQGWDTVSSVSEGISRPTVAIEVDGGTHVTAGIVTHNTTNDRALAKIPDMDVEAYRKRWPEYYAQNQSYMRMSGRRMLVMIFMAMGYPWDIKEFHIPFDPAYSNQIRNKYLTVRQAVDQAALLGGCCGRKVACPARNVCPHAERELTPAQGGLAL